MPATKALGPHLQPGGVAEAGASNFKLSTKIENLASRNPDNGKEKRLRVHRY